MLKIDDLFADLDIIKKINIKLPQLFIIAEAEASRGGKLGMEIGTVRERIIIALLRHYFGKSNISTDLPITEKEADVIVLNTKISIKTSTGNNFSGIKAIWTVDWDKVNSFVDSYSPTTDMILIQIVWNTDEGGFFYIPQAIQKKIFDNLGNTLYFKKPPRNTNPRGVEYSKKAIKLMIEDPTTSKIPINWIRTNSEIIDVYKKWEDYWKS